MSAFDAAAAEPGDDVMPSAEQAFDDVATAMKIDPDDDVTVTRRSLSVNGTRFAVLEGDELVLDLPVAQAGDLVARGVASAVTAAHPEPSGRWVAIADRSDWLELASESHQFVGEPPVGRQS